jgi:hypothetical protein
MPEEINTLADLVRAVSDIKTAGYEVDFEIQPRSERYRVRKDVDEFWLVVKVESTDPGGWSNRANVNGEWWFWADNTVLQVL